MSRRREQSNRNTLIAVAIVAVVVLAGAGYYYFGIYVPQYQQQRTELLTLNIEGAPADLDPAHAIDTDSYMIVTNVYDGLTKYKRGTTEVEPALATSWETPDTLTFIFHLQEGLSFHDGTPFNAEAVKYSFDRVYEIQGAPAYLFDVINSTEVINEFTVQVNLNYDFAPFPSIMANPVASIVSPTAAEEYGDDINEHPVGTGPYVFDSWTPGRELVLIANEEYWGNKPQMEKVVFKTILEATARKTALEEGEVDIVVSGHILPEDLPDLENNPDIKVYKGEGVSVQYLGFNGLNPPLNDSRVREAIAYAIDYDAIINEAMGGVAERVSGPIPPSIQGYKQLPLIERDLDQARSLLAEAGYESGFTISLTHDIGSLESRLVAEIIRNNLVEVGVTVRIVGLDWESAIDSYLAMEHEMMLNNWFPDYFDPDSYLFPQFHSWSAAPWGANVFGLNETDIDYLIDDALLTTDQAERIQLYGEAQERIVEEIPCLFLYVPQEFDSVAFNVQNWVFNPYQLIELEELYKE
jgi:peptide/nickel transport system substrate-binding protein